MAAFVIALAILMWMWSAMGLHLVRWLAGKADVSVQLAYLAVVLGIGVLLLLALAWFVLPGSVLSEGWTRRMLEGTQQVSAALVLLVAAAGFWRVWRVLSPPLARPVTAKTAAAAKARPAVKPPAKPADKEKRRP
jgi:type VI protein secretion system component VasK